MICLLHEMNKKKGMRKGMEEFERYYVNTKERVLRDVKKSLVTYSPKIETYYRHSHFFAEEF